MLPTDVRYPTSLTKLDILFPSNKTPLNLESKSIPVGSYELDIAFKT
jgi:hypothetical protein